ncbi:TIGR04283 family arsenosugar biosynthesis glycosyltransferase [Reichenbachiella versicolor]|uniref:TIGR04283 family arsenosugar biosynthesis glycosyltransferase n=1 Tax=Reichenbachiella versicolor TaxID=1821036 RepID=UPI0013A5A2A5|nr:glycosyltransferase family 2 protein [Reichenbachiella versicolor]
MKSLSIIIPTLNEATNILQTVQLVKSNSSDSHSIEMILVDAGSNDNTVDLVRDIVDQVIEDGSLAGAKYKSLNSGAAIATGEYLLWLDADSVVPYQFDDLIVRHIEKGYVGGAFEFDFDNKTIKYQVLKWINRFRYWSTSKYFGDQGLFCSRKVFEEIGGYPEEPIMEAAYFCRLLQKQGRIGTIKARMVTSARRFEENGFWKVFCFDTVLWLRFLFRLPTSRFGKQYWEKNQNRT